MTHTEYIDLPPLMSARGTVVLPGSKSISNRVLLLAALSEGVTVVRDLLHSDDTDRMLEGLQTLGVTVESLGGNAYKITGCGGKFPVKQAELFLGNAGTAFRPVSRACMSDRLAIWWMPCASWVRIFVIWVMRVF